MPRGPIVTDEVKNLIKRFHHRHPKWTAKTIQKKVSEQWHREHLGYPPDWPKIGAVQSHLRVIKGREKERSEDSKKLDEIWTFSKLAEYPMAPEAMPIIVAIYDKCARESNYSARWMPSIREMRWAERLYEIIEFYKPRHILPDVKDEVYQKINSGEEWPPELKGKDDSTIKEFALFWGLKGKEITLEDIVLEWAFVYSEEEVFREVVGEPFDSREFDVSLMLDIYEFLGDRRQHFIADLSEEYGIDVDKLIEPNMSLWDIEEAARLYKEGKK